VNIQIIRPISKLIPDTEVTSTTTTTDKKFLKKTPIKNNQQPDNEETPIFYLSNYRYGGCTTFTAHLLHILTKRKYVNCLTKAFNKNIGNFGYGIKYERKPIKFLDKTKKIFIADMYQNFYLLRYLNDKEVTIVIHDPHEIFRDNKEFLKNWKVLVIRKSMRAFLKEKYNINAEFIYHPFFPYKEYGGLNDHGNKDKNNYNHISSTRSDIVSISRIAPHKNIDMLLRANKKINKNPIKIFGLRDSQYVFSKLNNLDFNKYYCGMFDKSFREVSKILHKSKFMVDLSEIPNDGGGTQYTFLEAIYNNCAIILNRNWIESVDKKYRDFDEGYNCYAVSNERELIDLINNSANLDTEKVIKNSTKLMHRHIQSATKWNKEYLA
jgi:glycosyltransferase involved in cell wall biosynthesis